MLPKTIEERYPHPLSDNTRAMIFHAFKRALCDGNLEEAAKLEEFAQPDVELSSVIKALREQM